jgi:hypothetical protein
MQASQKRRFSAQAAPEIYFATQLRSRHLTTLGRRKPLNVELRLRLQILGAGPQNNYDIVRFDNFPHNKINKSRVDAATVPTVCSSTLSRSPMYPTGTLRTCKGGET